MNIKEELKELNKDESLHGYLNVKEIIHISFVTFTWLITSGYGLYFLNLLERFAPFWMLPIISIISTILISSYKILRALNQGNRIF